MRKFLAIIICKLLRVVGKIIGKGSSLPGKFALKVCPNVLSKIKLPEKIVAVTGSNGKTSTVEMIAHILRSNGLKVIYNAEGSNQIEGVTTFMLSSATLGGRLDGDVLLIESDERYAKYTFKHFAPTHYVITNLYRDQLTRNGHPMWVYNAIRESIHDSTQLILNADDPLVSLFGKTVREPFGLAQTDFLPTLLSLRASITTAFTALFATHLWNTAPTTTTISVISTVTSADISAKIPTLPLLRPI